MPRIYASVTPTVNQNALLWHQLGGRTRALVGEHISDPEVVPVEQAIAVDAQTFEAPPWIAGLVWSPPPWLRSP